MTDAVADDSSTLVEMAKLAEQAERYDDMVKHMKELTKKGDKLSDEQRNLLSVAFKNVVGARRSAWRIISSIENKAGEKEGQSLSAEIAKQYRQEIEKELEVSITWLHSYSGFDAFFLVLVCVESSSYQKNNWSPRDVIVN